MPSRVQTLKELLQEATSTYGNKPFICKDGAEAISYRTIHTEWQEGAKLIKENVSSPKIIGVWTSNKLDGIRSIGICIYSSMPYVPIDAASPIMRLLGIIEDAEMGAIWVSKDLYSEVAKHLPIHETFETESLYLITLDYENIEEIPQDLAYILYTSGSTGIPKGVMISHSNALGFINWAVESLCFKTNDVFASISEFHFDLSILDFFACLKVGGSVVFMDKQEIQFPRSISQLVEKYKITVIYATPTFYRLWMEHGKLERFDLASLCKILYAGEPFPINAINRMMGLFAKAEIFNLYGPTETNVCMYYPLDKNELYTDQIPIGKATAHMMVKITGGDDEGELYVRGKSVFIGYWKDKEKTSSVIKIESGKEWYSTGDIVKQLSDGNYIFKGRVDRMIKRRGYRIELDEIESGIMFMKKVGEVAVLAINTLSDKIEIIAFFTTLRKEVILKEEELRRGLRELIPLYMMPDRFIHLDEIPLTSTMKADYQALIKMLNKN